MYGLFSLVAGSRQSVSMVGPSYNLDFNQFCFSLMSLTMMAPKKKLNHNLYTLRPELMCSSYRPRQIGQSLFKLITPFSSVQYVESAFKSVLNRQIGIRKKRLGFAIPAIKI